MKRIFLIIGSISAFLAVAAGAFGAHILKTKLAPELLEAYEIAVRYQMYHALAVMAVALLVAEKPVRMLHTSGWLFIAGIVLFSGSLYMLSLTGVKWYGAITPFGGIAFLGGWLYIMIYGINLDKNKKAVS
jgi:uncharacterized membrane protein YgdD (TMEM256/DUF423 family)